jgi:hypothetical protein
MNRCIPHVLSLFLPIKCVDMMLLHNINQQNASFWINILIFLYLMSSTCFEPKGSSSGRRLYIQVWHSVFYVLKFGI